MAEPQWIWRFERVIPSKTQDGRQVLQELLEQLQQNRWDEHDIFSVHLAMEEALINAIKHGNQHDPTKRISVACALSSTKLRIEIADQGGGFDPDRLPDPTDPEHIVAPSGRGIMLIRTFMSRVEYLDRGSRVIMEKDRSTDSGRGV